MDQLYKIFQTITDLKSNLVIKTNKVLKDKNDIQLLDEFGNYKSTLGGVKKRQIFTSNGTWYCPNGVVRVKVLLVGAGGRGGDGWGTAGAGYGGGGGGAGAVIESQISVSGDVVVTVGMTGSTIFGTLTASEGEAAGYASGVGPGVGGDGGRFGAGGGGGGGDAAGTNVGRGGDYSQGGYNSGNHGGICFGTGGYTSFSGGAAGAAGGGGVYGGGGGGGAGYGGKGGAGGAGGAGGGGGVGEGFGAGGGGGSGANGFGCAGGGGGGGLCVVEWYEPVIDSRLTLWNKFSSLSEVNNSIIGPDFVQSYDTGMTFFTGLYSGCAKGVQGGGVASKYYTALINGTNIVNPNKGCIECWFKSEYDSATHPLNGSSGSDYTDWIISLYDPDSDKQIILNIGDPGYFRVHDVVVNPSTSFVYFAGVWHHCAITWNVDGIDGGANTIRVYINGALLQSVNSTITPPSTFTNARLRLLTNSYWPYYVAGSWTDLRSGGGYCANVKVWNYDKINFSDRFSEFGGT
jgi:hypothetical protein